MAASALKQLLTDRLRTTFQCHVFDRVYRNVKVVQAGQGFCVCEMVVEEEHQNRNGTLHGGMTATLVDTITSLALSTVVDEPTSQPGVSVDMNITYMSSVKVGEEIQIDARLLKHGKKLAFITSDIKEKSSGRLIAQGRHTKYLIPFKPETKTET